MESRETKDKEARRKIKRQKRKAGRIKGEGREEIES